MMKTMRRMTIHGAAALALLLTVGASDVVGQIGPRGDGARRGEGVGERTGARGSGAAALEGIIRLRDRLELTDAQVARLDALRSEEVARRARDAAELQELRSQLRAGTIEAPAAREGMQALREARQSTAEASRAAIAEILDDEQEAEVEELQARRRAFQAGRRSAIRDRGWAMDRPGRQGRTEGPRGVRRGG